MKEEVPIANPALGQHPKEPGGCGLDTIWMGSDHGGYELKQHLRAFLEENSILYNDVGSFSTEIVRYPHYAGVVAGAVSRGDAQRGILICSTGIGMSIIANKYPGVRASVCTSTVMGRMTRAHNDSNILCLGGKITGVWEALEILQIWLSTPYEGGRHAISLGLIEQAEMTNCTGSIWAPAPDEEPGS
jgi:ribose 5-phosphate isomerase B